MLKRSVRLRTVVNVRVLYSVMLHQFYRRDRVYTGLKIVLCDECSSGKGMSFISCEHTNSINFLLIFSSSSLRCVLLHSNAGKCCEQVKRATK